MAFDLVAELDQADAALLDDQGVVVPFVPALEPELAGFLGHHLHPERVRVVVAGLFQVRDSKMHVAESNDCAAHLLFTSVLLLRR